MDVDSTAAIKQRARELLQQSIGPDAEFRPDQWNAIHQLVCEHDRLLLVQRTGWGKSTVYFIATKLLRERGHGPTVIISPLLALMRNQIQDAETQLNLNAWTINSNNTDEWDDAKAAVTNDDCDILLISPERLANPEFQSDVLAEITDDIGMLVVDEAHCISDWGHDFRPDYRRIKRIINELAEDIPIAATTATANDRVIADVTTQVPDVTVIRGDLVRESLHIQTTDLGSRARRLAWLAENTTDLPGSGIVYCLTTDEVETVAAWLNKHGVSVEAYHGGLESDDRQALEDQLMSNEVDGLVATNALGMGFNKPDLGWVIHFQRPPNLIRYYQEIGRAGRALDDAYAVLLTGDDDDTIAEYFIDEAFPAPDAFHIVLTTLEESDEPLYKYELLKRVNISWKAATQCLDILRVDNAIIRVDEGFVRSSSEWSYDHDRIESVTQERRRELDRIKAFATTDECLARFIDDELDGSLTTACGRCANCRGAFLPTTVQNESLVDDAVTHYQAESWDELSPRYFLPTKEGRSKIDEQRKPEPGRVLSVYGDPGYGDQVRRQHEQQERYSQELVDAAVTHITTTWEPEPSPTWVTGVPSGTDNDTVADLAERIANALDVEYVPALEQVRDIQPQHELENSYQKRWNVEGAFTATNTVHSDPVLLIDDTVRSRWTLTEAAFMLRDAGSGPVYPFALAERKYW